MALEEPFEGVPLARSVAGLAQRAGEAGLHRVLHLHRVDGVDDDGEGRAPDHDDQLGRVPDAQKHDGQWHHRDGGEGAEEFQHRLDDLAQHADAA